MRLNTVNICADALIDVLAGSDALADTRRDDFSLTPRQADEAIGRWVHGFTDTGAIDAMMYNVNYHVSYIPSRVFDMPWLKTDGTVVTADQLRAINHWSHRFVSAHEMGVEPFGMALAHTREAGVQNWFSVRMNEFHYLKWPETCSSLWLNHPEYRLAPDKSFDYRHAEVRQYYVDYIAELCENWDIDGVELDMIRRFDSGAGDYERGCVTECVRRVRETVNAISQKKGKAIKLSARVYGLPEAARDYWCDAAAWVRDGLVDGLTLSNFHTPCDFDFPIERWREIIGRRDGYFIQAGSDFGNYGILWNDPRQRVLRHDTESMKGFAESALAHGADGVYVFNLNDGGVLDFGCLNSRDTVRESWRRQILTKHDPGEDYKLPLTLSQDWQTRSIFAGGGAKRAVVRVGTVEKTDVLSVRLNGAPCRLLGRLLPEPGEEYVPGVAWNDYARRIVRSLTAAVPFIWEFELDHEVPAGYAQIDLRGQGEVMWLELRVED